MKLSKGALLTAKLLAEENRNITQLSLSLKKSIPQIRRYLKELKDEEIIDENHNFTHKVITTLLLRIIENNEKAVFVLADSGIPILASLIELKQLNQIKLYSKIMIYKKIQQAKKLNMIVKEKNMYVINKKIWSDLHLLLSEIYISEQELDREIPVDSIIYVKKKIILFSNKRKLNNQKTAFSVFSEYGIKIMNTVNYYCFPRMKLSLQEVLNHSFEIAKKEMSTRLLLYSILFYLKFKNKVKKQNDVEMILAGKILKGYPTKKEIEEKAEIYDIKL